MNRENNRSPLLARFAKLTLRERLLVLAAVLVVLGVLWNSLYFQPLMARRRNLQTRIQGARGQISQLTVQTATLLARQNEDPDRVNRQVLKGLQEENARLDARLRQMTVGLISPREMPEVLEDLLKRETGLRLVTMKNLPAVPVMEVSAKPAKDGNPAAKIPMVYRHGLRMEFEGSYLDTLKYLRSIERLPRRLFWDDFDFKMLRYPKARVIITVHTLNLNKGWIGV